jgi:hypothetical protein
MGSQEKKFVMRVNEYNCQKRTWKKYTVQRLRRHLEQPSVRVPRARRSVVPSYVLLGLQRKTDTVSEPITVQRYSIDLPVGPQTVL